MIWNYTNDILESTDPSKATSAIALINIIGNRWANNNGAFGHESSGSINDQVKVSTKNITAERMLATII